MPATKTYFWQPMPILRLLFPFIAGVCLQWYWSLPLCLLMGISALSILTIVCFFFLSLKNKFRFSSVDGIAISLLMAATGALLVTSADIRNNKQWFGKWYKEGDYVTVRLLEPLVEKQNSFKAVAAIEQLITKNGSKKVEGEILLYFKKDTALKNLDYGSQLVLRQPLQEIKNAGNPGSFDYRRYCLFQGITHRANLSATDFVILPGKKTDLYHTAIFSIRKQTVGTLQKFIGNQKDAGLAEALLIGYKNDLDKNLVQAYSNTGVVHIIAISGLHLALIYKILFWLTRYFKRKKKFRWIQLLLVLGVLWAFSFIAGGQPSVLRSAVMFTCIGVAEIVNRRSSVYNALFFSAFLLLCYNPFWLWDVGFQLSYSAVLSILVFFRPIYNWVAPAGWLKKKLWELVAATLAAQILTLPLVIYHFHQFPLMFLIANLVAVPLSSGILIGELALLVASLFSPLAVLIGWLLQKAIWLMNTYVECLSNFSFAIWNGFSLSIGQSIFLYGFLAGLGYWLLEQKKNAIWFLSACLGCFILLRSISFTAAYKQKELIVYDVPQHQAIDLIEGRSYTFIGDSDLLKDDFIRNFHLQPSRILHRATPAAHSTPHLKYFDFEGRKVMIIDSAVNFDALANKPMIDVVVLSKNPKLYIGNLTKSFAVKKVVMDGSVPDWKKKLWKRDCDSLHLSYYDVTDKGAFVMKIQ